MPHLLLEYSQNLRPAVDVPTLLTDLHSALGHHETVDLARVKSRACPYDSFLVRGWAQPGVFLHITVSLLEGRSPEVLKRLGETLQALLKQSLRLAGPDAEGCAVTIELREMKRQLYFD